MKSFKYRGVLVQVIKDGNMYYGGFTFGYDDKRNHCGFLGGSLGDAFSHVRNICK